MSQLPSTPWPCCLGSPPSELLASDSVSAPAWVGTQAKSPPPGCQLVADTQTLVSRPDLPPSSGLRAQLPPGHRPPRPTPVNQTPQVLTSPQGQPPTQSAQRAPFTPLNQLTLSGGRGSGKERKEGMKEGEIWFPEVHVCHLRLHMFQEDLESEEPLSLLQVAQGWEGQRLWQLGPDGHLGCQSIGHDFQCHSAMCLQMAPNHSRSHHSLQLASCSCPSTQAPPCPTPQLDIDSPFPLISPFTMGSLGVNSQLPLPHVQPS